VPDLRTYLRRYWLRFDSARLGAGFGYGVTAESREAAEQIVRDAVFNGEPLPEVLDVIEDVDVRELDAGHVLPNMGDPAARGVWYPRL
jgi:hypothetical protein